MTQEELAQLGSLLEKYMALDGGATWCPTCGGIDSALIDIKQGAPR